MAEFKHKRRQRLSRQDAGQRLVALGEALQGAAPLQIDANDGPVAIAVAAEVELEEKVKSKHDEAELELELTWSTPEPVAEAVETAPAPDLLPSTEVEMSMLEPPETPR